MSTLDPLRRIRQALFAAMLAALLQGSLSAAEHADDHASAWPGEKWPTASAVAMKMDQRQLQQARDYALSAGGSGIIVRGGNVVMQWGDQSKQYDIKSATKSVGATALGLAVKDGKIDLQTPAKQYHPSLGVPPKSNQQTGWLDQITIQHLATQTAGFDKPGGYEPLLFQPGTHWHYSDGGPNWLAECITLQYKQDLQELMFDRVFAPIGIKRDDLRWRANQYRPHDLDGIPRREFGAGVHANVDALARIGYLYLHGGRWRDQQILSEDFVRLATRPVPAVAGVPEWNAATHGNASQQYGLLWWTNADGSLPNTPRDAYWAWGLYDSLIVVIPSLDLVVARAGERGRSWPRDQQAGHYQVLEPFFGPIVGSIGNPQSNAGHGNPQRDRKATAGGDDQAGADRPAPYPPSPLITDVRWAEPGSIIRWAAGSDNWPLTWGDDDQLYTAYGDGWGFQPKVEKKLSLGLARITGNPPDVRGENLRSADAERVGQGRHGLKASGMLMVEGVLYMLVRNADNAQLAWSDDDGKTWEWSSWRWSASFGCPTFLNCGKNNAGARDGFVYVYSFDSDSAYEPADRMVLARVGRDRLRQFEAYEYFAGLDAQGDPRWTHDIQQRAAVFSHPGRCYRSGITYHATLDRYLWCQTYPESSHPSGTRFQGGFGIYDAPQPWGPWTTVYHTNDWDVGPGETSSLPTKWISGDGLTLHFVFSGDDCFSVRRLQFTIAPKSGSNAAEQSKRR